MVAKSTFSPTILEMACAVANDHSMSPYFPENVTRFLLILSFLLHLFECFFRVPVFPPRPLLRQLQPFFRSCLRSLCPAQLHPLPQLSQGNLTPHHLSAKDGIVFLELELSCGHYRPFGVINFSCIAAFSIARSPFGRLPNL